MKKKQPFLILAFLLMLILTAMMMPLVKSNVVNKEICQNKEFLVDIDEINQEMMLNEAERKCMLQKLYSTSMDLPTTCPVVWDLVSCWPEASVNETVYLQCPNYIDKFNTRHKVAKSCIYDEETNEAVWSKSNYTLCSRSIDLCYISCNIENHIKYIIIIRICGYVVSMVSLVLSIIILLRPKLRCPRNYVHINLFVAFTLRTILVMLVDSILNNIFLSSYSLSYQDYIDDADKTTQKIDAENYIACKIMMTIFRYSGSVYHMAIFSEALYLVLLLKFPYYNELKGCKFCICISWVLPILWMIPWVFVRAYVHNYWCWQTESTFNLILKIPHTLLLISNISCAVFIIRILYSKMRVRNLSREKIIKYRRLAKSILILIPIFGLHFIFFAWLPYASLIKLKIGDCFEVVSTYIETFFNAFQGLVVAITCCFIHREVRVEFILYGCSLLKRIRCLQSLRCMQCLDSDYITQLRYDAHDNRAVSMPQIPQSISMDAASPDLSGVSAPRPGKNKHSLLQNAGGDGEKSLMNGRTNATRLKLNRSDRHVGSSRAACCSCLFSDNKNDFFNDSRSKSGASSRKLKASKNMFARLVKSRANSKKCSLGSNSNNASGSRSSPLKRNSEDVVISIDTSDEDRNETKPTMQKSTEM